MFLQGGSRERLTECLMSVSGHRLTISPTHWVQVLVFQATFLQISFIKCSKLESYNPATALGACILCCVPGAFWTWFLALAVGHWAHSAVSSTCHTSKKPSLVKTLLVLRPLGKPVPILSVSLCVLVSVKQGQCPFSCRLSLHSFTELCWGLWHILMMRASSMLTGTHQRAVSCRYDLSECIPTDKQQPVWPKCRLICRLNYMNLLLFVNYRR